MKTKATHNGTCQACGRRHAATLVTYNRRRDDGHFQEVTERWVAKHGYAVIWNTFQGTCQGSDEQPMEDSHALADKVCEALTAQATDLEARNFENTRSIVVVLKRAETYPAKTPPVVEAMTRERFVEYAISVDGDHQLRSTIGIYGRVEYAAPERYDTLVKHQVREWHQEAKAMREHVEFLTKLKAECFGQPLTPRAKPPSTARIAGIRLLRLKKLADGWTPFPFQLGNYWKTWTNDGLVRVDWDEKNRNVLKITEKGKQAAESGTYERAPR